MTTVRCLVVQLRAHPSAQGVLLAKLFAVPGVRTIPRPLHGQPSHLHLPESDQKLACHFVKLDGTKPSYGNYNQIVPTLEAHSWSS
jgi:hypothetical protein